MKEHEARPKAVGALLKSLNLSTTFFHQVQNMTERDEIYTARDLEELDKTNNETKVCIFELFCLNFINITYTLSTMLY